MRAFWARANKAVLGGITVVVFFLLQFLWWLYEPTEPIPMWVLFLAIIGGYVVCLVVYAVTSRDVKITYALPEVKAICDNDGKIVFIVGKNELFTQGAYATIAFQDEDSQLESLLGLGYVETINSAGNMQVVFIKKSTTTQAQDIISKLTSSKSIRKAIRIKPTVQRTAVEEDVMSWGTF